MANSFVRAACTAPQDSHWNCVQLGEDLSKILTFNGVGNINDQLSLLDVDSGINNAAATGITLIRSISLDPGETYVNLQTDIDSKVAEYDRTVSNGWPFESGYYYGYWAGFFKMPIKNSSYFNYFTLIVVQNTRDSSVSASTRCKLMVRVADYEANGFGGRYEHNNPNFSSSYCSYYTEMYLQATFWFDISCSENHVMLFPTQLGNTYCKPGGVMAREFGNLSTDNPDLNSTGTLVGIYGNDDSANESSSVLNPYENSYESSTTLSIGGSTVGTFSGRMKSQYQKDGTTYRPGVKPVISTYSCITLGKILPDIPISYVGNKSGYAYPQTGSGQRYVINGKTYIYHHSAFTSGGTSAAILIEA